MPFIRPAAIGGLSYSAVTHSASAAIGAAVWSVALTLTNPNAYPVAVALALSGADAAGIALYAEGSLPSARREAGASIPEIEEVGIPASSSTTIWIARAPTGDRTTAVGAVADCTLTLTHTDGTTSTVAVTSSALATLGAYAASLSGALYAYTFPASDSYNDQVGTNHLTNGSTTRGAAEVRGADGVINFTTGQYIEMPVAPTRAGDFTCVLIWDTASTTFAASRSLCSGAAYDDTDQPFMADTVNGNGSPDVGSESGSSPTSVMMRLAAKHGGGGVYTDVGAIKGGDSPLDLRTALGLYVNLKNVHVVTYDVSETDMYAHLLRSAEGREIVTLGPSDPSSGATSTPSAWRVGAYASANTFDDLSVHHLSWFDRVLTAAEIETFAMLSGLLYPLEVA